ncbi:MAG: DUF721 domain-containing protein [bacterium]
MVSQIKEILERIIERNAEMPRVLWEFKIAGAWGKVNPANVTENTAPDKLVDGVLYVNAKNSAWAQQINILKPEIILKLNAFLGESVIKDIRIKAGVVGETIGSPRGGAGRIKEKEKKNCANCGVEFFLPAGRHGGEESLCASCFRQKKQEKGTALIRLVQNNPTIKLEEARKFVNVSEAELSRARRDTMAKKADKDCKARGQRGR